MWSFLLSLFATVMLVMRRTAEKKVAKGIDSLAMAWLQQAIALPFIIVTLFFAKFYMPTELSGHFWATMAVYVLCTAIDLFCYFKALSLADISYVAPLLTLVSVGNIIGAYFVLGQKPSVLGAAGAVLIVAGAYIVNKAKKGDKKHIKNNRAALLYVLLLVVVRSYFSNIEVPMLRVSNPTSFNFYSSLLTVPLVLLISSVIRSKKRVGHNHYWKRCEYKR